jgi:hypothetical protein
VYESIAANLCNILGQGFGSRIKVKLIKGVSFVTLATTLAKVVAPKIQVKLIFERIFCDLGHLN